MCPNYDLTQTRKPNVIQLAYKINDFLTGNHHFSGQRNEAFNFQSKNVIDNVLPGQDDYTAQRVVTDEYGAMVEW